MLSITSTGNVILCLNGGVVMFIQSVSYVVWCDRHFKGFCILKETNHFYMILLIIQASCLNVETSCLEAKKMKLLSARMPALTH